MIQGGGGGQTIIILPHLCVPKVHAKNFALKISRNIIRRFCKIIAFRLSFHTYKKQIAEWINSDEFRESYINKHHPYPPLLNTKNTRLQTDSSSTRMAAKYSTTRRL